MLFFSEHIHGGTKISHSLGKL